MRDISTLRLRFFAKIEEGSEGLDLGAGDGRWVTTAANIRTRVTAIDRQPAPAGPLPIGSSWIQADLHDGLAAILKDGQKFDFMMCFNAIQFMPRDYILGEFLPSLAHYARPDCVLGLCTFWKDPNPAFEHPFTSLYTALELVEALKGWEILQAEQRESDALSLDGVTLRHWYATEILAHFP